jgi:hypothetical protein
VEGLCDLLDEFPVAFSAIELFQGSAVDGDFTAIRACCEEEISLFLFVGIV